MATKPEISFETRQVLEDAGLLKRPKLSAPGPNVSELIEKATKQRGYDITLTATVEDPGNRLHVEAVVQAGSEAWSAESSHAGVALANALAEAIRATTPQQMRIEEAA